MANMVKITGVSRVKSAMKRATMDIGPVGREFEKNIKRAGLFIQRISQEGVPVDTSALKNSAGTEAEGHGFDTEVAVFYTATYAVYVHERTDLRHKPGKQAKFLEGPIKENRKKILAIMAGRKDG